MASSSSSYLSDATTGRHIVDWIHKFQPLLQSPNSRTTTLSTATVFAVLVTVWYWKRMATKPKKSAGGSTKAQVSDQRPVIYDPKTTDPDFLRENSEIRSFTTSRFTYPGVRVFFKPHNHLDELPKEPAPLPLLVFVHGLGGSVAQFHQLLTSLTHNSSCLAVDLPGCGVSKFAPTSWEAYTNEALVELLETIIESYRDKKANQAVVLIGHSMGCALSARLASPGTSRLADHVVGLVAICPPTGPPTESQVNTFRKLLRIPTPIFNLWRAWDARGGPDSASVKRFVGADADIESKRSQYRYNRQSRTPVWRRMAWGSLPVYENGVPRGGIAGEQVWATLNIPIFLIGGGKDHITPANKIETLAELLKTGVSVPENSPSESQQPIVDVAAPVDTTVETPKPAESIDEISEEHFRRKPKAASIDQTMETEDPTTPQELHVVATPPQTNHPDKFIKCTILSRGTHAMIYTQDCSHILASIIADFLSQHVTGRLSRSWQLQHLNKKNGKWDVKNLAKWQSVEPVSKPIAGVFRAMKTMREVDDEHSPDKFVEKWGGIIKDIVDLSKDTPVYDPAGLERAGVRYHKFPTVSKIPPTDEEVDGFVKLVERLREEQKSRVVEEAWDEKAEHAIGVHCHYGFNRTGYFIVCYLVEKCGFGVQQAIDAFAEARPKGIRHSHFKDQLF
ncbi:mRNA-capping enzyme [Cytospora mali]|uniref:mRNA-capping enzyme n=1 Tax=Cytospora mali TaxID=578113 RepID=A0A194UZD4_CYTMA|nr:mRNA-capping enzyme [Valsa mali var. pyri (nom. inval.)]